MVKGKIKLKDKDVCLIGLSEGNIRELKKGRPIYFEEPSIFPEPVLIMYGKTEQDIAKELEDFLNEPA